MPLKPLLALIIVTCFDYYFTDDRVVANEFQCFTLGGAKLKFVEQFRETVLMMT